MKNWIDAMKGGTGLTLINSNRLKDKTGNERIKRENRKEQGLNLNLE